jgi:hypothetical protein
VRQLHADALLRRWKGKPVLQLHYPLRSRSDPPLYPPYVGPDVFLDVLTTTLGLGEPSAYELRNIWGDIEEFGFGSVSFTSLYEAPWYYNKRPGVYLGHLSFGVNCAKLPLFQDKD